MGGAARALVQLFGPAAALGSSKSAKVLEGPRTLADRDFRDSLRFHRETPEISLVAAEEGIENQTSVAAGPADRAPQSPGAASHSDTSVFSDEGDQTIIAAADEQRNHLPALVNAVVPPSPPTESAALRTVKQAQGMTKVEEDPTYAPFRRAVECQKQISDVLFDPTTKVTNPQRAKILGLVRQIIEECADLRAMAANQTGRIQELRHQIRQAPMVPLPHAPGGNIDGIISARSYAAVAAQGLPMQVPQSLIGPPPVQEAYQNAVPHQLGRQRQEHAHVMYLAPIVPSTSPAIDVMKILKTNIDPTKEKLAQIDIRKTRHGKKIFMSLCAHTVRRTDTRVAGVLIRVNLTRSYALSAPPITCRSDALFGRGMRRCGYTCDFVYSCHRTRSTRLQATTDTLFEELDNGNLSDVDGEFDDSDDKSVQPCASGEAPMESDSESSDDESGLDISGG
ncbi:hypothetical protein HPB50_018797 [Hyalomma asiaticum]|uniref:Uncharacterized protein n=1 Tax=Hyalomma asiaticum TaxID=266040 RepID=A0ACB7RWA0_HYAAI|nr:hypothetical protein HPB50_018797 [Hyalomma asiaticum]